MTEKLGCKLHGRAWAIQKQKVYTSKFRGLEQQTQSEPHILAAEVGDNWSETNTQFKSFTPFTNQNQSSYAYK